MTQKSLAYMIVAVAVGYLLVSAVPQQLSLYATPQLSSRGSESTVESATIGENEVLQAPPESDVELDSYSFEEEFQVKAVRETFNVLDYAKWWTVDILVALSVYWVARRKLV